MEFYDITKNTDGTFTAVYSFQDCDVTMQISRKALTGFEFSDTENMFSADYKETHIDEHWYFLIQEFIKTNHYAIQ